MTQTSKPLPIFERLLDKIHDRLKGEPDSSDHNVAVEAFAAAKSAAAENSENSRSDMESHLKGIPGEDKEWARKAVEKVGEEAVKEAVKDVFEEGAPELAPDLVDALPEILPLLLLA
jgi:hypothetical protein